MWFVIFGVSAFVLWWVKERYLPSLPPEVEPFRSPESVPLYIRFGAIAGCAGVLLSVGKYISLFTGG